MTASPGRRLSGQARRPGRDPASGRDRHRRVPATGDLPDDDVGTDRLALRNGAGLRCHPATDGRYRHGSGGAVAALIAEWRQDACEVATTGCVYHGGDLAARVRRPFRQRNETVTLIRPKPDAEWDEVVPLHAGPKSGRRWRQALDRADAGPDRDRCRQRGRQHGALLAEAPHAIASQLRLRQSAGLWRLTCRVRRRPGGNSTPRCKSLPRTRVIRNGSAAHGAVFWNAASRMAEGPAAYGDVTALGALAVLRAISLRPALATPVVDLPPEQAAWLRGPGMPALASLDRKVTLVVSSEAETATLREPAR